MNDEDRPEETDYFTLGYNDRKQNKTLRDNPYGQSNEPFPRTEWIIGWCACNEYLNSR